MFPDPSSDDPAIRSALPIEESAHQAIVHVHAHAPLAAGPSAGDLLGLAAEDLRLEGQVPRAATRVERSRSLAEILRPQGVQRWRGLGTSLSKVCLIVLLAWGLLFNFSEVRGSSMEPGIHDRDRIMVDHLSYLFSEVASGDIVVLRYPLDPSLDYIKRIVGLPGDKIRIAHGQLWINGELIDEPYVSESAVDPYTRMETTVRPDHYFVMGDNRLRSSDSREFGQVPRRYLRGKVRLRVWPPLRAGMIN